MQVRITVPEAAKALNMNPGELRKLLRQNKVPYGRATEIKNEGGRRRFRYDIWLPKLMQETGLTEWPPGE